MAQFFHIWFSLVAWSPSCWIFASNLIYILSDIIAGHLSVHDSPKRILSPSPVRWRCRVLFAVAAYGRHLWVFNWPQCFGINELPFNRAHKVWIDREALRSQIAEGCHLRQLSILQSLADDRVCAATDLLYWVGLVVKIIIFIQSLQCLFVLALFLKWSISWWRRLRFLVLIWS